MICNACNTSVDVATAELEDGDPKKMRSRLAREQRAKETPEARRAAAERAAQSRWSGVEIEGRAGGPIAVRSTAPVVEAPRPPVVEQEPPPIVAPADAGAVEPPKKPPAAAAPSDGGCHRCGGRSLACMTKRCACECHEKKGSKR